MAITTPGDLVLDVVRAASPAAAGKAEAMLELAAARTNGAVAATDRFSQTLASSGSSLAGGLRARLTGETGEGSGEVPEAYRKFEAMVLGNFVQSMLPSDGEEVFGKGTAGEIWKGMMADEIGKVIARGGGIGIAERMARQEGAAAASDRRDENVVNRAASMVNEMQMDLMADLVGMSDPSADSERL